MSEFDMVMDTKHTFNKHYVPIRLQDRVCMCDEHYGTLFDYTHRAGPLMQCCKACRKPFRWYIRHCTVCHEWFIKDFRKKSVDCVKHTKCWEHTVSELYTCTCDKEQSIRTDYGPLGFNPREVSEEEMNAAFDMPSVFD